MTLLKKENENPDHLKKKDILNYQIKKIDSGPKSPKTKIATGQNPHSQNSFRKILIGIFNQT